MAAFLRSFLFAIGLLCTGVGATEGVGAPSRYALLVGVDTYPNLSSRKQLATPVRDADALGKTLATLGFKVTVLRNPSLDEMASGINQVANQLRPGDVVLFFFAGHGASPDGTNLFLPSDVPRFDVKNPAAKDLARKRSYAESDIISKMQTKLKDKTGQQDGLIILVSDACRDNPFADSGPSVTRSLGGADQATQPKPTAGVFSIYAAGFGQESLDRLPDEQSSSNSIFMRVFLQQIARPGKALAEIAVEVRQTVRGLAATARDSSGLPHLQTVAYYDETLGGPIFLAERTPGQISLSQPTTAAYKTLTNRDISGGDYRRLQDVDVKSCVTECRSNAQCLAFSYDKWNRWCFLKSEVSELLLDPRSLTGVRQDTPTPKTSDIPARMETFRNKIFLGDGYKTMSSKSFEKCRNSCEGDLSCVVFTFLRDEEVCKFFKTAGEYFEDRKADSGIKTQTAP